MRSITNSISLFAFLTLSLQIDRRFRYKNAKKTIYFTNCTKSISFCLPLYTWLTTNQLERSRSKYTSWLIVRNRNIAMMLFWFRNFDTSSFSVTTYLKHWITSCQGPLVKIMGRRAFLIFSFQRQEGSYWESMTIWAVCFPCSWPKNIASCVWR